MRASNFHLCLISILSIISLITSLALNTEELSHLFFYSTIFYVLNSICLLYSIFEMLLLHEKQGSKLDISTGKLSS